MNLVLSDGELELEMDRRTGASSAVKGEEGAEPEGEGFSLLLHLCSNPQLSVLAWKHLEISQGELESVPGERDVWVSLLDLLSLLPTLDR